MIKIQSISCAYDKEPILKGLSAELCADDFTVLIGPNGAGKSSLLYAVMGFLVLKSGDILIGEKSIKQYKRSELSRLIAYVPQETVFSFDFKVEDLVMMGRYPYQGLLESWTDEDRLVVDKALNSLELGSFRKRWFSQLSGGEKQRVLIARALAQETRYIFLDESLSQLDINHQLEIMNLLAEIREKQGKAIVLISHNLNLAANFASKIIYLKSGRIVASGNSDEMMRADILREVFGIDLQTAQNPISGRYNIVYPGR